MKRDGETEEQHLKRCFGCAYTKFEAEWRKERGDLTREDLEYMCMAGMQMAVMSRLNMLKFAEDDRLQIEYAAVPSELMMSMANIIDRCITRFLTGPLIDQTHNTIKDLHDKVLAERRAKAN